MLEKRKMFTLYDKIGEDRLQKIVQHFYAKVFVSPIIGQLFQTNKELIQQKQYQFLSQFLGGPQKYTAEYGHPKMRMRHLPHAITNEGKEEWLRCMKAAIEEVLADDTELGESLYQCFPPVAQHMVNR